MAEEADLLRKIQGLLRKAEGTDNENEASAFFEKAHELMVKHAIDEARVWAERKRLGAKYAEPVVEDYMFSSYAHHAQAKEALLGMVCATHSVRSLPYSNKKGTNEDRGEANRGLKESQWTRLVGYRDDIENVKLLYLSLLVQSQRFASEDWRTRYGERKYSDEGLGKFTWLSGHMEGFADRIGERFRERTEAVYHSVLNGRELILDKDANVLEWMYTHGYAKRPINYCFEQGYPPEFKVKKNSVPFYCIKTKGHEDPHVFNYKPVYSSYSGVGRRSSYEGRDAGRNAANRADIGFTRTPAPRSSIKAG